MLRTSPIRVDWDSAPKGILCGADPSWAAKKFPQICSTEVALERTNSSVFTDRGISNTMPWWRHLDLGGLINTCQMVLGSDLRPPESNLDRSAQELCPDGLTAKRTPPRDNWLPLKRPTGASCLYLNTLHPRIVLIKIRRCQRHLHADPLCCQSHALCSSFLLRADGSRRCWKSDCAEKARTEDVSSSSSELPTSTILMRYPFGGSAPYGGCFRQSVDTQSDVEHTTAHILPNVVASHLGSHLSLVMRQNPFGATGGQAT